MPFIMKRGRRCVVRSNLKFHVQLNKTYFTTSFYYLTTAKPKGRVTVLALYVYFFVYSTVARKLSLISLTVRLVVKSENEEVLNFTYKFIFTEVALGFFL